MTEPLPANRFLTDENLHGPLVRALLESDIEIVRCQDTEMLGRDDPALIGYAADEGLVLISHDADTLPDYFYEWLAEDDSRQHPGVIIIPHKHAGYGMAVIDYLKRARFKNLANQVWWYPVLPP